MNAKYASENSIWQKSSEKLNGSEERSGNETNKKKLNWDYVDEFLRIFIISW